MIANETLLTPLSIYFDDLDAGGVVYHPSYLKLCDRVRNQALADLGFSFQELLAQDFVLTVVTCNNTYRRFVQMQPIVVLTRLVAWSTKSLTVRHAFYDESVTQAAADGMGDAIDALPGCFFSAETKLVGVILSKKVSAPLPPALRAALKLL